MLYTVNSAKQNIAEEDIFVTFPEPSFGTLCTSFEDIKTESRHIKTVSRDE